TEVSFNTWIKSIEPISLEGNNIILGVPNSFTKDILIARYATLIINAIKQTTSNKYEIKFVVPSEEGSYVVEKGQQKSESTSTTPISSEKLSSTNLNPKYTFDTFVIGNSNRFAHAASVAVAESPAKAYNPLF